MVMIIEGEWFLGMGKVGTEGWMLSENGVRMWAALQFHLVLE